MDGSVRDEQDRVQALADSRFIRRASIGASLLAAVAIAVHLIWPQLKIDLVTVALIVFGSLPWLRGIVQSISLPGGPSIDLRHDLLRVIADEAKQSDAAVQAVGSAAGAGSSGDRAQQIARLATSYEKIRRDMPSGAARTAEMAKIARQILSLLPIPGLGVQDLLLSPQAGQRLTAYLALVAEPDSGSGEQLIETLTEREGIPYNQNWALRALNRILDLKGTAWASHRSIAMLEGMRDGLRPGSDRQLMLTNVVDRLAHPAAEI